MAPPNDTIKLRSRPQPLAWALFFSVLLNLFLVGAFLGVVPHVKHHGFGPLALGSRHGENLVDWMTRYLDPDDALKFREAVNLEADALKAAHAHVHQAIKDLANVFKQDPPDAAALQNALDRLAAARKETNDVVGKILEDAYGKVSPEGRRRLAELAQNPM